MDGLITLSLCSWQGFVAGTGHREAVAKGMITKIEEEQQVQWTAWKERISELRNAILEHPNVDSSALGVFDRDALEVRSGCAPSSTMSLVMPL